MKQDGWTDDGERRGQREAEAFGGFGRAETENEAKRKSRLFWSLEIQSTDWERSGTPLVRPR